MTLDQLEELADVVLKWEFCCEEPDCSCKESMNNFIFAANPTTIKELIALCRRQNRLLRYTEVYLEGNEISVEDYMNGAKPLKQQVVDALTVYEKFGAAE